MLKKREMNKSGKFSWKLIIIVSAILLAIVLIIVLLVYFKSKTLESQADKLDEQAKQKRAQADILEKQAEKANETESKNLRESADKLRKEANDLEAQADAKLIEAAKAAEAAADKLKQQASALRDKTGTRWKEADLTEKANILIKEKIPSYTKKFLGFEEWKSIDHYFITYLLLGLLTGLWMWIGAFVKNTGKKAKEILLTSKKFGISKNTWLDLVAGSLWKLPIIAIGYAVIMQVPIINRFIQVITFDVLGLSFFFKSIVLAFYIGFGPAWIEQYARYKLRMKYYKKIQEVKYGAKIARSLSSG